MTLVEEAVAAGAGAAYENGSDPDIAASSSSTFKVQEIILGIATDLRMIPRPTSMRAAAYLPVASSMSRRSGAA